jgi:hypothetical protein
MRSFNRICALFALSLMAVACGGRGGSAATLPTGAKIAILVYSDRGVSAETPDANAEQVNQVADWMEGDLIAILQKTGYESSLVANKDEPTAIGRYLLRMQVVDYNGGSKAAREFVGWGAGAAHLQTHFELIGPNGAVYLAGSPSVGTGRSNWQHVARKVNLQTVDSVNRRLRQSL